MEKVCILLLITLALAREYPLFNQCDTKWANEKLGTSTKTICSNGQILTSLASGLAGIGKNYNPSTLNTWLKGNKGYVNQSEIVWKALNPLGITFEGQVPNSLVRINIDVGYLVIINVKKGAHWVLATGYTDTTIYVRDSKYNTVASYDLSEVVTGHSAVFKAPNTVYEYFTNRIQQLQKLAKKKIPQLQLQQN